MDAKYLVIDSSGELFSVDRIGGDMITPSVYIHVLGGARPDTKTWILYSYGQGGKEDISAWTHIKGKVIESNPYFSIYEVSSEDLIEMYRAIHFVEDPTDIWSFYDAQEKISRYPKKPLIQRVMVKLKPSGLEDVMKKFPQDYMGRPITEGVAYLVLRDELLQ